MTAPHPELAAPIMAAVDAIGLAFLAVVFYRRRAANNRRRAEIAARKAQRRVAP